MLASLKRMGLLACVTFISLCDFIAGWQDCLKIMTMTTNKFICLWGKIFVSCYWNKMDPIGHSTWFCLRQINCPAEENIHDLHVVHSFLDGFKYKSSDLTWVRYQSTHLASRSNNFRSNMKFLAALLLGKLQIRCLAVRVELLTLVPTLFNFLSLNVNRLQAFKVVILNLFFAQHVDDSSITRYYIFVVVFVIVASVC